MDRAGYETARHRERNDIDMTNEETTTSAATGRGRAPDAELTRGARASASILAALAAAAATLLVVLVRLNDPLNASTANPADALWAILGFYVLPVILFAVLLAIAGVFGAFRHWLAAGAAGLIAVVLGTVIANAYRIVTGGQELNGDVFGAIFAQFAGLNFTLLVAGTLFAPLAGVPVYRRSSAYLDYADARRGEDLDDPRRFAESAEKTALVRVPAANLAEGARRAARADAAASAVDVDRASEQWESYVELLERHGWETREVVAADTMADSVFTEDQVVVLSDVAILARSGAASRRAELPGVRSAIDGLGLAVVEIEAPATLDGGDVLAVGGTVYVGASPRTNAEGIRALRGVALGLGYRVVAVELRDALHLRDAVSALPDGTLLVWADGVEHPELLGAYLPAPEREGANVLALDAETVLVPASAPVTAELVSRLGYAVETLDVSEFEKLDGGVSSLSARSF